MLGCPVIKSALLQTKSQELSNEPSELCFRLFPNFSDKLLLNTLYPFDAFTKQKADIHALKKVDFSPPSGVRRAPRLTFSQREMKIPHRRKTSISLT